MCDNTFTVAIPTNVENLQLPSPELITFYKNLEERVLWIDSQIDDLTLEFARYIMLWNREDKGIPVEERKPIKLMFFSPGGDLSVNNAMIDVIEMSKTPVYGYNIGEAASAGCFIFMACHKRFAMPKSVFLLHKGSGQFSGDYNAIIAQMLEYQRQIDELADFVLKHSKISREEFEKNINTEWFIPAQQAVEYGICDKIITDIDETL